MTDSSELLVTVRATLELELEVKMAEGEDAESVAAMARDSWRSAASTLGDAEIVVSIEPAEWKDTGRFGTGPDASEADMLARMQREAEEAAGLV